MASGSTPAETPYLRLATRSISLAARRNDTRTEPTRNLRRAQRSRAATSAVCPSWNGRPSHRRELRISAFATLANRAASRLTTGSATPYDPQCTDYLPRPSAAVEPEWRGLTIDLAIPGT